MALNSDEKRKKLWAEREELSTEGKALWDKMMELDGETLHGEVMTGINTILTREKKQERVRVKEVVIETDETQRLRLELTKMMQVSRAVIIQCQKDMVDYTKQEEYFKANECKVAILCHSNMIIRLEKILAGGSAYDTPSVLANMGETLAVK